MTDERPAADRPSPSAGDGRSRLPRAVLLVLGGLAADMGLGWLARSADWPLFLDSVGTVVVGAILGPVAGALTGAGADLLTGLLGRPEAYPFAVTGAFIGWAAAFAAGRGAFSAWYRAALAGALTGLGAALISAPIAAYVFGRPTETGLDYATQLLQEAGANVLQVTTVEGLLEDPVDKTITFVAAWALLLGMRRWFPPPGTGFTAERRLHGYSASVLVSLLAAVVTVVFRPALGDSVILVFFLAVLVAALAGARGPGLLSVAVGACVGVLTTSGRIGGDPSDTVGWIGVGLFAIVATAMVFIIDDRERGRRELADTTKQLRQTNARLLAITDSVQEGLLAVDPGGRILAANRHFYEMLALPAEGVADRPLESLGTDLDRIFDERAPWLDFIRGTLGDPEGVATAELQQKWPVPRELVVISSPVRAEAEGYIGRLIVLRDVTRERTAEREKNEFFSAVSHELRTPLTSIKGYSEMILDGDAGDVNDEALEYVGIVHSNSERLVGLVNDLLDFQRMASGRMTLSNEPVDLDAVTATVRATMGQLIAARGQHLHVEVDPDARWTLGDEDKTQQVLTNYVSNAYKYSPEGARIAVRIRRIGDHAHVAVSDTGMGISTEDQKLLFTKFYRVDNSATREIGGTGLGLSIVAQIVAAQGGEVGVTSTPGEGSTFSFTMPLLAGEPPARVAAPDGRRASVPDR